MFDESSYMNVYFNSLLAGIYYIDIANIIDCNSERMQSNWVASHSR